MKSGISITKAVFLSLAFMPVIWCAAWGGQPEEGPENIKQAQGFYRAGQKYMRDGNFTAANDAFAKAEFVLSAADPLPITSEDAFDAPPRLLPQAPRSQALPAVPANALDPDIYYNLGVGALQKGDFVQAEAAFRRVLELSPIDAEACYNLGVLYEKYLDRPKDARVYYTRYINLSDEGDRDAARVKSWIKEIDERARE
ncbi:MAG: tetratricopeptide repeat protein [Candidatus Omnitrophota bacterium]